MHKSKTLDPVLLGRPLAAFDALAALLSRHVSQQIQQSGHRSLSFVIQDAHFVPLRPAPGAAQDTTEASLSRDTVLQLMAQRYGFEHEQGQAPAITRTEERIASALQTAVVDALQAILNKAGDVTASASTQRWSWQAQIQVGEHAPQPLRLELSSAHSAQLELLVQRIRPQPRHSEHKTEPLQVELSALLLEKTVTAADIQNLRVGSVLPISLERARVTLNGQAMLTASVAEHQGKLHLTAFENLE